MKELIINTLRSDEILSQIQTCVQGELLEVHGERVLTFNNKLGKGSLRTIAFDRGVSLFDCNITLAEEAKLIFISKDLSPIEFIFISEGYFTYSSNNMEDDTRIEQFQNTIIAHKRNAKKPSCFLRIKA